MHDAYLRLVDVEKAQQWDSRRHFFAAAAEAMRRILVENARRKRLTSVDFSPDPKRSRIVTGSEDGTAKVWDLDPDRELLTRSDQGRDPRNGIHSVGHSRDGGLFVSASWETVKVWRSDTLSILSTVERDNQSKAAISPDGQRFATPRSVWNAKTDERIHDLDNQAVEFAPCAFSPDGRFLATAKENQVRV